MKTKMKIFNVIFALTMLVMPARGDDMSACDGYEYFSPAFALCSVHAYNIGDKTNPTSANRTAEMNDIIALKSTVIAQQLKEQYDILNTMIKRFKTQLEKAVLTSKIEVLTGNNSSSNGGGYSSGSAVNNNGLANAENCYDVMDQANVYDCFARNLAKIAAAADSDTTNARKQLKNDMGIMSAYTIDTSATECKNIDIKNNIKNCVQNLQVKVRMAKSEYDLKYRQSRYPY
jgi:hypothetical protein